MTFPYLLHRMTRRKTNCLVNFLIAFIASLLLYYMHIGECTMSNQIDNVYEQSTISCAVTNLTGTQSDNLNLSYWVVDLFSEPLDDAVHTPETSFLDYIKDVQFKITMQGMISGQSIEIIGITSLSADRSFRPEENTITWFDKFDESVFKGTKAICVVTEDIYQQLITDGDYANLTLEVHGKYNQDVISKVDLEIAGICSGKKNTVYCPWGIASTIYTSINGKISADCIYATIINNREIAEFEEKCVQKYFAEVDPYGEPQAWDESSMYDTYPYAFAIYDDTLNQTVASLQQHQSIYRLCQKMIIILTMGIGFIIGNLSTKQRQNEIALQNVLGLSISRIFAEVWLEHLIISCTGFVTSITTIWCITSMMPPWENLLASFGTNCIGVTIAIYHVLNKRDVLQVIKRGD